MDTPRITAKDFFLWAGAMISFYWSVIAFILLTFDYINYAFPNALAYYPSDPYQSGISGEMASLIVLLPLFLWLMQSIRNSIVRDPSRKEVWVRRWAIILTLFVAGIAIAADLITLLTTFLNGEELTTAFLLKVLIVLLVAAGVFMHFIADMKGYWEIFPARRLYVRVGVAVLALVTIVSGFFIVGTPQEARLARFDAQKVNDLQSIQYQVINYWQAKQQLPASLTDLTSSLSGESVPVDTQTGAAYSYQVVGALSFKLCASFNTESRSNQMMMQTVRTMPAPMQGKGMMQDSWSHASGYQCFDRTIDPAFYPPLTK